jgi:prepilin peptidase CpaA
MDLFPVILLISAITVSVVEDLRRQKIPNLVTFPTMVLALIYHGISSGLSGFFFSAGGLALGMGFFMIPYMMGGMGAGDVKLMGATGAIFGPMGITIASILVFLAGGLYGFVLFALNPKYTLSFIKRSCTTIHIFITTFQFIPMPPEKDVKQPVLKFAIPIATGALGFVAMKMTGYDLIPELLGDNFKIFTIALFNGGTG